MENITTYYIYNCIVVVILFWWSPNIPSSNLYEVSTYNYMDRISLRSSSHVKASMVLTIVDNLCIHKITSKYYFNIYSII